MAQTRTGLNNWLGEMGTNYAHELTRQAARIASELGEEATSGKEIADHASSLLDHVK